MSKAQRARVTYPSQFPLYMNAQWRYRYPSRRPKLCILLSSSHLHTNKRNSHLPFSFPTFYPCLALYYYYRSYNKLLLLYLYIYYPFHFSNQIGQFSLMANQGEAARNMVDPEKQRLLISQHREKHFNAGEVVRDIIIGVSDGLTVPFALAAGLSGANASSSIVLTAGIAEVAAGAISMGLGGYCIFFPL